MGLQLVFVVETNKSCKSDWIYIKDTIDRFYTYDQAHVKLSTVYMDGKSKYADKEREVKALANQYNNAAAGNHTKVIYCFDCDDYDTKPEDANFLTETIRFCNERNYKHVWFCKDVERVYLKKKVADSQKKREAATFKAKKLINNVDSNSLSATDYRKNTSNLLRVLDQIDKSFNRK